MESDGPYCSNIERHLICLVFIINNVVNSVDGGLVKERNPFFDLSLAK